MELAYHPFFSNVAADSLQMLMQAARVRGYQHGDLIFDEGQPPDSLYLILHGAVVFKKRLANGTFLSVSHAQAGDYFGEIGIFTQEARSLRAEAEGVTEVAWIPRDALLRVIRELPGPVENILQSLIRHLHETTRHYVDDMVRKEKMSVVGHMVNTIIHDFKNPFCLISLSAQLIRQKNPDDPNIARLTKNIEDQVDRMVEMANELAEFSRGEQRLRLSRINLANLMEEFRQINFPFFDDPRVRVHVDIPSVDVQGEKNKLFRVFQNLITNAFEAIGGPGNIVIQARPDEATGMLHVVVADDGPGIPPAIRSTFFEPFVTSGKRTGTGLGSAIVKAIVEGHGGTITFETATGEGTAFHIQLPLAPAYRQEEELLK